jgi:hypothetical protein
MSCNLIILIPNFLTQDIGDLHNMPCSHYFRKSITCLTGMFALCVVFSSAMANEPQKILFIGNSFTFGYGSASIVYRADSINDLNNKGGGGIPALFKSFADQSNVDYSVYTQTQGGAALDFHLEQKLDLIGSESWDKVVMHGFSTLDSGKPGNPAMLIDTAGKMADFVHKLNPNVQVFLTSTWTRADLVYQADKHWSNTPIEKMALDVREGNNKAMAASPYIIGVNPVGEAWTRAMKMGIADENPYNGIDFGKVSLWTWDHYHSSTYGDYLHALVVFGNLTGIDPRTLGEHECSALELGISKKLAKQLQQAAFEQLNSEQLITAASSELLLKQRKRKYCE